MKKKLTFDRKIIFVFILLICGFIYLISKGSYSAIEEDSVVSNSYSENIILNCVSSGGGNKLLPAENIICTISVLDLDINISSFSGDLELGNNLTLVEGNIFDNDTTTDDDDWLGSISDGNIDLYTGINKSGDFGIASFVVFSDDINSGFDTKITLKNIVVSDEKFDEIELNDVTLNLRINSTINTLESLDISGIDYEFDSNNFDYDLTTNLDSVVVNAVPTDSLASVDGDIGEINLNYGENVISIYVISEAGNQLVYTLNITRTKKISFSNDISVDEDNKYLEFYEAIDVATLLSKIDTNGIVIVKNMSGVEMTGDSLIATNCKVSIYFGDEEIIYNIILYGDINGDGSVSVTDVAKLFQYYRGTITMDNIYTLAGDVKNDLTIKLTDVAKLFQYVRGSISNLR